MGEWAISAPESATRLLKLSGRWGVEGAEELHQAFTQALEQSVGDVAIHVDLEDLEDVDLTFFQVLGSAAKSMGSKELYFVNIPEHVMTKAEWIGFAPRHVSGIFRKGA
ncbi:STAS domain-containing protein [Desulfonatronum thiodismutans]|uniref:STAS domain-containing protein n=1 Tax=Desulfonatronum thiodismutans TaxID=159290 RepID=UPI0004ABE3EB|nr:STAS domain-containing protein [Desulfonatronum thiodismutans]